MSTIFDQILNLPTDCAFRSASGIKVPPFRPGERVVLFETKGPGAIGRISLSARVDAKAFRGLIFRAYWDDEKTPSIEAPLGDFFGIGHVNFHGLPSEINLSTPFLVRAPDYGLDSYFSMPFATAARIEVVNDTKETFGGVLYSYVDYRKFEQPLETPLRFHAAWRRECPAERRGRPFTILEAKGSGYLVGACYHVQKLDSDDRWTHGGGDMLFIDGENAPVFTHDIGGENWIGGSGGCYPFSSDYSGCHFADPLPRKKTESGWCQDEGGRWSIYRFYLEAPVRFRSSLRMNFGCLANNIASTAYWYQEEPHASFTKLPTPPERVALSHCPSQKYLKPITSTKDFSVAVLGPFLQKDKLAWKPGQGINTRKQYRTGYRRPFGFESGATVAWLKTKTRMSFLDLSSVYRPKMEVTRRKIGETSAHAMTAPSGILPGTTCFVAARVKATRAHTARLLVGHDSQGIVVWLNGKRVTGTGKTSRFDFEEQAFELSLRKDWNEIVLQTTLTDLGDLFIGWVISLRLEQTSGLQFDRWTGVKDAFDGTYDYSTLWKGEQR